MRPSLRRALWWGLPVLALLAQACSCGGTTPCPTSGSCADGKVCDASSKVCRTATRCADEGVCKENQQCEDGAAGADATCLTACTGGLFWNFTTQECGTVPPGCGPNDPNSILAACTTQHRLCATSGQMAACGACVDGYQDFAGSCEVPATCAEKNCLAENRACEALPNGHCTTCLPEFVEDTASKQCRPPISCATLTCPQGQFCLEPAGVADARCDTSCGANAILGPDGKTCHGCPACTNTAAGERGPYLGGLTGANQCICTTANGFFWREDSRAVSPCDLDGDGWVRESAKLSLESTNAAVKTNARCALRKVNAVVLENELGQTAVDSPATPLDLYETDRNDDAALLAQQISIGKLPASYGPSGRQLTPPELNSLVKYCGHESADYNENGLADVNEWQDNPNLGTVKATFRGFAPFVYFGELHVGWYEPPTSGTGPGRWHVKERSRLTGATPGAGVEMVFAPDAGEHGRICDRQRDTDSALAGVDRNGVDFTRFPPALDAGFAGMNHHSQFKCVQVAAQASSKLHWLTPQQLADQAYVLNDCTLTATPVPPTGVDSVNPSTPALTCAVSAAVPAEHQVRWANVGYVPYTTGGYHRGCVNECAEYPNRCPGYDPAIAINPSTCAGIVTNFGKLQCACDYRFSGPTCGASCPGNPANPALAVSNLFLDSTTGYVLPDGGLVPSPTGYWMCGKPSATAYADPAQPFLGERWDGGTDSGYYVEGEIPALRATAELVSEDGDGGGYAIR